MKSTQAVESVSDSSVVRTAPDNKGALEGGAAAPFVDLYQLLEVSPASDVETLRKRIAQVYGEAQQNADHRNFRKRFYYQELLEVYLPQARHLLLHPERRAEYDDQLRAFLDGKYDGHTVEFRYNPGDDLSNIPAQEVAPSAEIASVPEISAKAVPSSTQTPAQSHAAKTPSGNGVAAALPTQNTAADAAVLEALARRPVARIAVDAPPAPPPAPVLQRGPRPELHNARLDASVVERRREHRRRELIQRELEGAGLFWGLAGGAAITALVGAFLVLVGPALSSSPDAMLGMPRLFFNLVMFAILLGGGVWAGRSILRSTRRRIVAELSKMPYEQLLKRCEHG